MTNNQYLLRHTSRYELYLFLEIVLSNLVLMLLLYLGVHIWGFKINWSAHDIFMIVYLLSCQSVCYDSWHYDTPPEWISNNVKWQILIWDIIVYSKSILSLYKTINVVSLLCKDCSNVAHISIWRRYDQVPHAKTPL